MGEKLTAFNHHIANKFILDNTSSSFTSYVGFFYILHEQIKMIKSLKHREIPVDKTIMAYGRWFTIISRLFSPCPHSQTESFCYKFSSSPYHNLLCPCLFSKYKSFDKTI